MSEEMIERLDAFLAKLDLCQPYINNAFTHMSFRCGEYTGPQYRHELEALKAARVALPTKSPEEFEKQAREMLAAEYEADGADVDAREVRRGNVVGIEAVAVRTIIQALQATPSPDGALREALRELLSGYAGTKSGPSEEGFRAAIYFDDPDKAHTFAGIIDTLATEAALATPAGDGWRAIEDEAPNDGEWFLAFENGEIYPCQWLVEDYDEGPPHEGWYDLFNESFEDPTHYMLLPKPPVLATQGEE